MARRQWKPGNMLSPTPAVLVSVADLQGRPNVLTVAWTGTVCSEPPMVSISVRPERYSWHCIQETGEFVINLTTKDLVFATDYCGVKSGREEDKFAGAGLTKVPADLVRAPLIGESPVCLECKVVQTLPLGSHTMFVGQVVSVSVEDACLDRDGRFHLDWAQPIAYSHGTYYALGEALGKFGFSVTGKGPRRGNPGRHTPQGRAQGS